MGGEAAKERRRLKRLEAQQGTDGKAAPSGEKQASTPGPGKSIDKKSSGGTPNQTKVPAEKSSIEAVRLRIQRKMARKASGKFKPQGDIESSPAPSFAHKRKTNDAYNSNTNNKSPHHPSKMVKRNPRDQPYQKNNQRNPRNNQSFQQKNHTIKNKFRQQKDKQPAKKDYKAKQKVKKNKPKHLKRKMDQLSKTMTQGTSGAETNVIDLEGQMKQLVAQMEEYKNLKQSKAAKVEDEKVAIEKPKEDHVEKDDTDKKVVDVVIENDEEDAIDKKEKEESDSIPSDEKESDPSPSGGKESDSSSSDDDEASKSDDNSSDGDNKIDSPSKSGEKETNESTPTASSSSSSDDDSDKDSDDDSDEDSDEDDLADVSNARSRGKGRKARRDTTPKETESKPEAVSKKTSKKDDKRRCIGRKPVTEYTIGKTYSGTVKYIKPKLGAFIDIGSHSDAFCHISCVSEEFVPNVADALKVNDVVENVRVVEINREKKRITVSLRSAEMAENEQERLKTTRQYENTRYGGGRNDDARKSPARPRPVPLNGAGSKASSFSESMSANYEDGPSSAPIADYTKSNVDVKRERRLARPAERRGETDQVEHPPPAANWIGSQGQSSAVSTTNNYSGEKSGADLKRERKLARRAERRAANEVA